MKTTITFIAALFILSGNLLFAQNAHFIKSGTIEFEKSVNMFAMIKNHITPDNEAFFTPILEAYKKNNPQFKKDKAILSFTDDKTLYTPLENESSSGGFFTDDAMSGQPNIIFTDLAAHYSNTQKKVYEETFMVKDSTRKIKWKITDETREIAGYICRRANAIVMDSVYVVAFYTEEIPVSGGPESFTNLPGMILGLALPHENVTWFATKVTEGTVEPKAILPPKKGKVVTAEGLHTTLKTVMKDWGPFAQLELKGLLL